MSKTKGNGVDPLGTIDEIGADALRFALNNGTGPGSDLRLTRAASTGHATSPTSSGMPAVSCSARGPTRSPRTSPWSLPVAGQLGPAEHGSSTAAPRRPASSTRPTRPSSSAKPHGSCITQSGASTAIGIWSWPKCSSSADSPADVRKATWEVLGWVLDNYLRLLHPLMPFVTEAIWDRLPSRVADRDLLMTSRWPDVAEARGVADRETAAAVAKVIALIGAIRTARSDAGVDPALMMDARVFPDDGRLREVLAQMAPAVVAWVACDSPIVDVRDELDDGTAGSALAVLSEDAEGRLVADAATREQERSRLVRELAEAERLGEQARARLADENFVRRAPAEVVEGSRQRLAELEERVERLRERLGEGHQTASG